MRSAHPSSSEKGRRYRSAFAAIVTALSLIIPLPALSESTPPTLAITTAWLESNLPSYFVDYDILSFASEYAKYTFDKCSMTVDVTNNFRSNIPNGASGDTVYTIKLRPSTGTVFAISTIQVSGEEGGPQLLEQRAAFSFKNVQPEVELLQHTIGNPHDQFFVTNALQVNSQEVAFTTRDAEMAGRLQKALLNLTSLCGAIAEPF